MDMSIDLGVGYIYIDELHLCIYSIFMYQNSLNNYISLDRKTYVITNRYYILFTEKITASQSFTYHNLYSKVDLHGKHAVVLGRSSTVGSAVAALLTAHDCTVTICHSQTPKVQDWENCSLQN